MPLQIHVGDKDAHVPVAAVEQLKEVLRAKPNAAVFVYPGAQHGFFNAARPEVYSPDAAKQAQARLVGMLEKAL